MKRLILFLIGIISLFSVQGQVTISEEEFNNLPESIQQQIRPNTTDVVIEKLGKTSKAVSIGKEIGTAVNETLTAVSDNVIRVAESKVGKTAIGIAMWKLLWKDIAGLSVGIILLGLSVFFAIRGTKESTKTEDCDEDFKVYKLIVCIIIAAVFFVSSMACMFGE